jgi:hypothetical protein
VIIVASRQVLSMLGLAGIVIGIFMHLSDLIDLPVRG